MGSLRRQTTARGRMSANRGFTLLEVLIALVVLSLGLLGLAALQIQGMKFTSESYLRTQASVLAYDIIERIRANKLGADAGHYGSASQPVSEPPTTAETCGDSSNGCADAEALARYDLTQWFQLRDQVLPGATTSITRSDTTAGSETISTYTITITWQERDITMNQAWTLTI